MKLFNKIIEGIKIVARTAHVRAGRKIKGGVETTIEIDVRKHAYGVRLEITAHTGDLSSVMLNGLQMVPVSPDLMILPSEV